MANHAETEKKPVYKKWWFWGIIILVIVVIGFANGGDQTNTTTSKNSRVEVVVTDFSKMKREDIQEWCDSNKVNYNITEEYSDNIKKGAFIEQSVKANSTVYQGDTITIVYSLGKEPSTEYKNALEKAESYSENLHMSKQAIYDQLISEYGEKFPEDAAQYAIDNMEADWKHNALEKAKTYQEYMNMSKQAIYDQLISEYGEQFTKEEAQYAIDNLED